MKQPNFRLKGMLIQRYGRICDAARDFGMREDRLGRVIHGRVRPSAEEKRIISWKLQKSISDLFGED